MMGSQAHKPQIRVVFLCFSLYVLVPLQIETRATVFATEIVDLAVPSSVTLRDNATLVCTVRPQESVVYWTFNGENVTQDDRSQVEFFSEGDDLKSVLHVLYVSTENAGNYTCHAFSDESTEEMEEAEVIQAAYLGVTVPLEIIEVTSARTRMGEAANLTCVVRGFPVEEIKWRSGEDMPPVNLDGVSMERLNDTLMISKLKFHSVSHKDNGTYQCIAVGSQDEVTADVSLLVLDKPQVKIDFVKAVGAGRVFLNWTVNSWNDPVQEYFITHMKNGTMQWMYYPEKIGGGNSSYVIKGLDPNSTYKLRIQAKNSIGRGEHTLQNWIQTLDKDPDFVPTVSVNGVTVNSITIGWLQPPEELKDHVHYYQLLSNGTPPILPREAFHPAQSMNVYLFTELQPATTYNFKVAACSEYTKQCGNWSKEVNGTTMDGRSGPPKNASVVCRFDNISRTSFVFVTWEPPEQPNGKIVTYQVSLEGVASFKNERGVLEQVNFEQTVKRVDEKLHSARFDVIPPNTNYTVRVSAVTRSRNIGEVAERHCSMPPTVPDKDVLTSFHWDKVEEQGRWLLKLSLPKISERNGPICCFRVFVVKLEPQQSVADLPPPEDFPVSSYDEVHHKKKGGAYVAEMFESAVKSAVFLGDGQSVALNNSACRYCVGLRPRAVKTTIPPTPTGHTVTSTSWNVAPSINDSLVLPDNDTSPTYPVTVIPVVSTQPSPKSLRMRRAKPIHTEPQPKKVPSAPLPPTGTIDDNIDQPPVYDGQLDIDSNYTGFVEVIVLGMDRSLLPAYSSYLVALNPGPPVLQAAESPQVLAIVLQVLCALILLVLVLLVSLCLLQRYTKQVAEAQGVEMTLTNSFRHLCRSLRGRHVLVSSSPPDMAPVAKEDLTIAYLERHRDSDYGFQQEFELLPDRFPDRTTRNSEARENLYKNRYPDIKAYDQTRIRLSQIDSVVGSDYINANFVVGYKERKKFICAQGPMDNTVCDFWRMIWEQHLELILMLTNLEEYSKTKCAKYWPDEAEKEKDFGAISVTHVREKRYSDYIIRELRMCRWGGGSGKEREERSIVQYHYLVWKDFMAPEHPSGILKFIKRVNEAYSLEKGPILVHCSAGVGRTGTLVALDSLLQQLAEEGQVAIFNTVCDLRHQRNFLVQSLKQYIFVYRALMEVAQFGDTEIKVTELKSTIEKLKQPENGKEKCKMEEEFEKINRVLEDRKSFSVGDGEENRSKNRNELVIPFDRNRVILTPIPGKEHSTYINASFIEGYDNSESFIITQDPLESTIADFWRMISEQSVSTLVMLSDLGDGPRKCLRYWPDDETNHNHIHVKYIQSESCPYYTRRELSVTNTKTDENVMVTQFQYNGWPTVEGEVPEVTRGLIELVDQTQSHQDTHGGMGPIVVHCSCGSERSSMFVALSILVHQLYIEKRVDIFTVTRKLRSQRHGMLQTFAQYEFLHRAILNYAELHHLTGDDS